MRNSLLQSELANRIVAKGRERSSASSASSSASGATEADDLNEPEGVSFAAARQAAISAAAAESDARVKLARKKRKRPRTTVSAGNKPEAVDEDDEDLDDAEFEAAAEAEAKAAGASALSSSSALPSKASQRVAKAVVRAKLEKKGAIVKTAGDGSRIIFGDDSSAQDGRELKHAAIAEAFLSSHFGRASVPRRGTESVRGGSAKRLGPATTFAKSGEPIKRTSKQQRRRAALAARA